MVESGFGEGYNTQQDFSWMKDYKPEEVNDDAGFKPLKGAYECRVDRLEHVKGTSDKTGAYSFYSLSAEITAIVEGDKGVGRYLKKTYQADEKGVKSLLNDMFTSGIELDRSGIETLDASLGSAKDKSLKIRAWVWTPEKDRQGNVIPEEQRKTYQQLKVVKDFKVKKSKDKAVTAESVPF